MQQLHLVGFTTDSESLILSVKKGAKSGGFVVPLDERLLEVIADAVRRRNAEESDAPLSVPPELTPPRPQSSRASALSPRELQARLRSGRSVAQVAREAGADEEWVAKFEPPVLAERSRIITQARQLVYAKPRRGESAEPLGLSVRWGLADRGIRLTDGEFDAGWSAYLIGDVTWGLSFTFVSRGRRNVAEWEVDFHEREVIARNRLASDLAYAEPGRRRRLATLSPPAGDTAQTRRADNDQAPAPRARATKAASRSAKKTAARKPAAKKAGAKKASAKASTRRTPAKKATSRKAATKKAVKKAAKRRRPRDEPSAPVSLIARTAPPPAPGNELARRRLELVGKQLPAARPARAQRLAPAPPPRSRPERERPPEPRPVAVDAEIHSGTEPPAAGETDEQRLVRERREERRRARAERLAAEPLQPGTDRPETDDDTPVVTIRASQAGASGDVRVRDGSRPLRPALPAAQPRRRRFTRGR